MNTNIIKSSNLIRKLLTAALIMLCVPGLTSCSVTSDVSQNNADAAVANILFDYEYSEEYTSYLVRDNGFVDVTFAQNIPTDLYNEIVSKLNNHPDIKGVLAGTTGSYCARF